jgi:hypothetical protein
VGSVDSESLTAADVGMSTRTLFSTSSSITISSDSGKKGAGGDDEKIFGGLELGREDEGDGRRKSSCSGRSTWWLGMGDEGDESMNSRGKLGHVPTSPR